MFGMLYTITLYVTKYTWKWDYYTYVFTHIDKHYST